MDVGQVLDLPCRVLDAWQAFYEMEQEQADRDYLKRKSMARLEQRR